MTGDTDHLEQTFHPLPTPAAWEIWHGQQFAGLTRDPAEMQRFVARGFVAVPLYY